MDRREFLNLSGVKNALRAQAAPPTTPQMQMPPKAPAAPAQSPAGSQAVSKADFTVHIAPVLVELSVEQTISTIGYNGISPGPLLRMREGVLTTVDVINDTDVPEVVHWHGQLIPSEVDGSSEEGTPTVPPHGHRRYSFIPRPAGTRWYHSHVAAGSDLTRGLYSGQYGFVYVEPKSDPGQHDHELFLALREWQPFFTAEEEQDEDAAAAPPPKTQPEIPNGLEVGYRAFSMNDKMLSDSVPLRVRMGDRVLFRLLNASATELRSLALPGHRFQVQALDGNPVPQTQAVDVLQLGPGERVDAIVEMNQPGIWILGCTHDDDRNAGMGIMVEYASQRGDPKWVAPPKTRWDYTQFGSSAAARPEPDGRFEINIGKINGGPGKFNRWTINGMSFPNADPLRVRSGRRYRLVMKNMTDDLHPMHLHRHIFELVSIDGKATAGVMKDTVVVRPFGEVEVEFVANQPGPTLFHCHQQVHMDFGLMMMLQYV